MKKYSVPIKNHLSLLKETWDRAYQDGYEKGLFLRKEYNDPKLIAKICSMEIQKAYKDGYAKCKEELLEIV